MREIALHILDVAENGVSAGASLVRIDVAEDLERNLLEVTITDNGRGMPPEVLARVTDPFYTTRTTRRVGLGLPFFKEAAERCGGHFSVDSEPGCGTRVRATFCHDHIDRMPLGDMTQTLVVFIASNPGVDLAYTHTGPGGCFELDTREIRQEIAPALLEDPAVLNGLSGLIREHLKIVAGDGDAAL